MDEQVVKNIVAQVVKLFPGVMPLLSDRTFFLLHSGDVPLENIKTIESYHSNLVRLVRTLYNGLIGEEFKNIMAGLISKELNLAKNTAYRDAEVLPFGEAETYLENVLVSEYSFVENFYNDILKARAAGLPVEPLVGRCQSWALRWLDVYNTVMQLIAKFFGEKMIWVYGDAEHCETCSALNGIVAYAREWLELGVSPQSPPNGKLECGGWRCKCRLEQTLMRKTRGAVARIQRITG